MAAKNPAQPGKKRNEMATAPTAAAVQQDETLGTFDFRAIREDEKPFVMFNDGDLAFTIQFTSREDRDAGKGAIYTAAMFRTMTDLTKEEFKVEYPVVLNDFWHSKKMGNAVDVTAKILREDWEKKLAGDTTMNDGDRAVRFMLLNDGNEGCDYILRSETALSKTAFKKLYPVTQPLPWKAKEFDSFVAELEKRGLAHPPTYTRKSTLSLFRSEDSRIRENHFGTAKSIPLSDVAGYFKYSDERGGIATFYRGDTYEPVFSVTKEMIGSFVLTNSAGAPMPGKSDLYRQRLYNRTKALVAVQPWTEVEPSIRALISELYEANEKQYEFMGHFTNLLDQVLGA
jgi:hypothetical protein